MYKRSLSLVRHSGEWWVQSNYTGEIVRPWEIRKILRMIWDFRLPTLY